MRSRQIAAECDFSGATFTQYAHFRDATFTQIADFSYATFSQSASFNEAQFSGTAYWHRSKFLGNAEFRRIKFVSLHSDNPSAVFALASISKPREIVFDDLDLSRVLFLNCDVSEIFFTPSVRWGKSYIETYASAWHASHGVGQRLWWEIALVSRA